jgi:hypothetical protein
MKLTETLQKEHAWRCGDPSLDVRCHGRVASEMAAAAFENSRRVGRGGLEIGGVLLGRRNGNVRLITEWLPIPCEHSRGPACLLSERDERALRAALDNALAEGLEVIGLFVSHCRSSLAVTDADVELLNRFFPDPAQVLLLLKPGMDASARARLGLRHPSGMAFGPEFVIIPELPQNAFLAEAGRPPASAIGGVKPAAPAPAPLPSAIPPPPRSVEAPKFLATRASGGSLRWAIAVVATVGLAIGAFVFGDNVRSLSASPSVSLRVLEHGQQLRVEWDRNSRLIQDAERATVEVSGGSTKNSLLLNPERLRGGSVEVPRQSDDITIVMTIHRPSQAPVQEWTRFVGPPAAAQTPPQSGSEAYRDQFTAEEQRIQDLESENEKLKAALVKETARRVQEERAVYILRQHIRNR